MATSAAWRHFRWNRTRDVCNGLGVRQAWGVRAGVFTPSTAARSAFQQRERFGVVDDIAIDSGTERTARSTKHGTAPIPACNQRPALVRRKGTKQQRRPGRRIERGAPPSAEALTGFVTCL